MHLAEGAPMPQPSAVTHWLGDMLSSRTGWVSLREAPRTGLWNSFPVSHPSLWGSEAKPLNLFFLRRHLAGTRIVLCELSGEDGNVWSEAFICISAFGLAANTCAHTHIHTCEFFWFPSPSPQEWLLWLGLPKARFASALMLDVRMPIPPPRRQALRPVPVPVPGTFVVL